MFFSVYLKNNASVNIIYEDTKTMSSGTFIQLNAFGASDVYLCARDRPARVCANNRNSIMYWFIDRKDGFATKEDIEYLVEQDEINPEDNHIKSEWTTSFT